LGDLTKFTPDQSILVQAIYDWHKTDGDAEAPRGYLGASIIGHECERYLWYNFRQCIKPEFDGRLYRLFDRGDVEEARMSKDLRNIGCTMHEVDPDTGEQFAVSAFGGHFSGHTDGAVLGVPEAPKTWHVPEFKTHNAKSFAKLEKEGVKNSKPMHYAQMMVYMGLTGMIRALYLACNKDTDALYSERIRYNSTEFQNLMDKAERIIFAQDPPERAFPRPDCWGCKFCDAKALCWPTDNKVNLPWVSERMCIHATPERDGTWSHANDCKDGHILMPCFIHFAEPVDAGDNHIEYKNNDSDIVWAQGNGPHMWTAEHVISFDNTEMYNDVPF
jgi:hypothetical protein